MILYCLQVFLLQHNQKEALSPGELQDKIMDMMKTNPDIAEAVSIQLSIKVAPSLPINLISSQKKYFKKIAYKYYDKWFLWRNLCWVWKNKQHIIAVPYF